VAWAPNDRVQPPRSLMSKHQVKRELMRRRRVAQVGPPTINQIRHHNADSPHVCLSPERPPARANYKPPELIE
jgi:hypothetical protein